MPVVAEGNVILIGRQRARGGRGLPGLSMLLSFVALITAMVILVRRPLWERVVLVLSIIPIALLCNIIRIAITAIATTARLRPAGRGQCTTTRGTAMMAAGAGVRAGSS